MPNTAVKPANAESTWGEAPWEDRKPLIQEKALAENCWCLFFRLPIRAGSWDKQGTTFEGGAKPQRANVCESLMPNLRDCWTLWLAYLGET